MNSSTICIGSKSSQSDSSFEYAGGSSMISLCFWASSLGTSVGVSLFEVSISSIFIFSFSLKESSNAFSLNINRAFSSSLCSAISKQSFPFKLTISGSIEKRFFLKKEGKKEKEGGKREIK